MIKRGVLIGLCLGFLLTGCDLIEYHPYDVRIDGETNINLKNIEKIQQQCAGKDTIRFAFMGDSQRWYDETADFVKHINKQDSIDFVIHGGDISDFGITKEFLWIRDIMQGHRIPYVALIGNHDILGNGKEVFEQVYGDENFAFIAGNTKFVCMNTNALEYDYSHPVPDFDFISREAADSARYSKTVAVMHVKPYDDQFNNNVARLFHAEIKKFPSLQFALHAHNHKLQTTDVFKDGIIYYGCASMKQRNYMVFTLTTNGYSYEVVNY